MSLQSWLQNLRSALATGRGHRHRGRPRSLRAATHRPSLEVLENRLTFSFSPAVSYPIGPYPPDAVATADFNNDGRLDLAVAISSSNSVSVLLGNANGTFQAPQTSTTGAPPTSLAVGDLNADGKLDLVAANVYANTVSVLLGNGQGGFAAPTHTVTGVNPRDVEVGDFNADGKLDVVTANAYDKTVSMLFGNGDGTLGSPGLFTDFGPVREPMSMAVDDFNADGKLDLAVSTVSPFDDVGGYQVSVGVLMSNGQGGFATQNWLSFVSGFPVDLAVADLNADGKLDLVTANQDDPVTSNQYDTVSVLLGNGDGTLRYPFRSCDFVTGDHPTSVVVGDFNRDGVLDIATANLDSNDVNILLGRGDGTFSAPEQFATGELPVAVAAGDFNGDGWLDAVTANVFSDDVSVLINDQSWLILPPAVSVTDATVTEGNTGTASAMFTLTLSKTSAVDVTVQYDTANITAVAGSDYMAASGDVTIPAGQTSATFTVAVTGDRLPELTETFAVNLSAATNATIGDGQGIGTILDDEPRISITDVTKYEGRRNKTTLFTFTVTLSAAYDEAVTVSLQTVNGTATTGNNDYVAKTATLTFAPGETTKEITISVKGDSKREGNEKFYLDLFGLSSNASFTKNRGIATILNDD